MAVEASSSPVSGLWQPQSHLKNLYYGPSCVQKHLLSTLPSQFSQAFVITGHSIATKTPLIQQLETLLGTHHAGTFSHIKQHGPVAEVDQATDLIAHDPSIDTIISVGGGSPIDAAKTISFRTNERTGHYLIHLTIPTTLSAAECTAGGGYTKADGVKTGFMAPEMGVSAIFYDPGYAKYTPTKLWLATGVRAVDHAVETFYHPYATEVPWKALSIWALGVLFDCLPNAKSSHPNDEDVMTRLMLAAFASSGLRGKNVKGSMGLSHSLGYALGSPYGIPHGETSCLTLGDVVKLKAETEDAKQIARLLPVTGGKPSGNAREDAREVGSRIIDLVATLGLRQNLTKRGVGKDQVPIIVGRATGGMKEGPLYDAMTHLVEGLY